MSKLRVYDRSRTTTDWKCPRERYWRYEHGGRGIVNGGLHLELFLGTVIHSALSAIAFKHINEPSHDGIDDIVEQAKNEVLNSLLPQTAGEIEDQNFALEQSSLVEGIVRGFYRQVWPRLLADYPVILSVEEEMEYHHDGLVFMSKPDLILGTEDGEQVVYVEYKSTSSKKTEWVNSWDTAVQLHSTIKAVEATKGLKVTQVIVQGLYKGYVSYGKQSSPFCYAYKRSGNPPFTKDDIVYDYKQGYKRYPVWELEGGVKKWLQDMPDSILQEQFPQTPPIMVKEDLVNSFFEQRKWREQEIKLATEMLSMDGDEEDRTNIMNMAFPQKFSECLPAWGKPCSFRMLCHGHVADPLTQGFEWRESHHLLEQQQLDSIEGK